MSRAGQGTDDLSGRHLVLPRTLCFVTWGDEVLLLRGAPDKRIWPNRYNGVGGHVERGEDVRSAARREIAEETGLTVEDLRLRGVVHVTPDAEGVGVMLFVFAARAQQREVRPSAEGAAVWVRRAVGRTRPGRRPAAAPAACAGPARRAALFRPLDL